MRINSHSGGTDAGNARMVVGWVIPMVVIVLVTLVFSLQIAPSAIPMGRDNGIFSYTARVMLDGGVIYRDAWDNKLPGVYVIDLVAFALGGVGRWSVWGMEIAFISGAGWLVFALARDLFAGRRWLGWLGAIVFVLLARAPNVLWDVNFSETYALLPQMLVFWLGWRLLQCAGWRSAFLMGLAASAAFLIKQTTIGVALAFAPALAIAAQKNPAWRAMSWLALAILGGLTGLGGAALWLGSQGVLPEAFDAAFVSVEALHTWISDEGSISLLGSVVQTFEKSVVPELYGPVAPLLLVGIGVTLARARRGSDPEGAHPLADRDVLALWAVFAAVIDLVLVNLSGRYYEHYYATLAPAFVLVMLFGLDAVAGWKRGRAWTLVVAGIALGVIVNFGYRPVDNTLMRLDMLDGDVFRSPRLSDSVDWLLAHTAPEDPVLVWGATSGDNFQSGRRSPTQYHYAYPLLVPDYTTGAMLADFLGDLDANLPLVIMDRGLKDGLRVPPLGTADRAAWIALGGRTDTIDLSPVFDWVAAHCREIDRQGMIVYYACAE